MADIHFTSKMDGKDVAFKIREEDVAIQRKCDLEYHKTYVGALKSGILPRATLEQIMKDHDVWTDEHDAKLNELQVQMASLVMAMESSKTIDRGMKIADEITSLRRNLMLLYETKNSVLQNSCEAIAEQVRREAYLAYATVYDETDQSAYKDYQDFVLRREEPLALDAMTALMGFITETFNEALDQLPETQYLQEIQAKKEGKKEVKRAASKKAPRKRGRPKKKPS